MEAQLPVNILQKVPIIKEQDIYILLEPLEHIKLLQQRLR